MPKEIEPVQQIEQRRDRVSQVLGEREALVDRIGTGKVKIGSSWENTLKVGRVRSKVKASITRMTGQLGKLDEELNAYGQARDYLSQLPIRRTQLAEMSEMVAEGNLPKDALQAYQQQYEELASLSDRNPALQRGIERIRREEEGKRGSEKFRLSTGEKLGGKIGELLTIVSQASLDSPITSDRIAGALWPGVDWRVSSKRLGYVMFNARRKAAQAGLDIVGVHPEKRGTGDKGSYYLRSSGPQTEPIIQASEEVPATIGTSTATGFRFEGGKIMGGEAGRLLAELFPFSSEHIITHRELLRAVSAGETLDDLRVLDKHLKRVRGILHQRLLRLASVPNPRDVHNSGYYVESIRRSNVRIMLLGDVIKYENKKIRLSEEQYHLLWALTSNIDDPKSDRSLSERIFNEPNPETFPLSQVALTLGKQLAELTGVEDIIVTVGNEAFGHFYKIKDATILRRPGYFPVHSTRLEALLLIFQDNPVSKQEIISVLGATKERKRASRALTGHQALVSFTRAVTRLRNRANADIIADSEVDAYLEMDEYMKKHKLADEKALLVDIAQKLGISHNSSVQEARETVVAAVSLSSVEVVESESTIETPSEIASVALPTPVLPKAPEPKPKALEVRDPDVRTRIDNFIDEILERPELRSPVSSAAVTRAFPRLKQNVIDKAVGSGSVIVHAESRGVQKKFDLVGIVTLLYLHEFGNNLTPKMRKQIRDITKEELKKRQEEK